MCKSLTNYFPRNNDFLVTYFGKTQNLKSEANIANISGWITEKMSLILSKNSERGERNMWIIR